MIKNVIFDVDGVLRTLVDSPVLDILDEPLKQKYSARYRAMTVKDLYKKYLTHDYSPYIKFDKGYIGDAELVQSICTDFDEPFETFKIIFDYHIWLDKQKYFEPTIEFAKTLKKKGYKIYILSNMGIEVAKLLKQKFGSNLFDDMLYSCDVHMMKPDKEFYEYAISKWNIDPQTSVFVDDRQVNLNPFSELGGQTFLFNKRDVENSVKALEKYILEN